MKSVATLVLVVLLAGCAAERGDGDGSATKQEEPTANATEETTVLQEETTVFATPEPPDSTLSYSGQEVKGTPGTYC
jgi:PBP1b-binding outer membrane lipoprotein LpoB